MGDHFGKRTPLSLIGILFELYLFSNLAQSTFFGTHFRSNYWYGNAVENTIAYVDHKGGLISEGNF